MAERVRSATLSSGPEIGPLGVKDMNAYLAEIIAADRAAALLCEAQNARLVRAAALRPGSARESGSIRLSAVVAAAAFIVTLWLGLAA